MDNSAPYVDKDGTHLIPIKNIRRTGFEAYPEATGIIRWQPKDGMTFEILFPGVSHVGLSQYYQTTASVGGAGSLQKLSPDADWHAETRDGQDVKLYGTFPKVSHSHTIRNRISEQHAALSGSVAYARVRIRRDNPLSFWHETTPDNRLFFPGVKIDHWPELEEVEFRRDDSICKRTRGFLRLADEPRLTLMGSWQTVVGEECGWLVYDSKELLPDDKWFGNECDSVRFLLSFLTCKCVPFLWRDTYIDDSSIERIYYGWQRVTTERGLIPAPVPLGGTIESLKFGRDVLTTMPGMLASLRALSDDYDVAWIMSPIWTAASSFADDKLALACVSLERLAQSHIDVCKRQASLCGNPAPSWLSTEAATSLREALWQCAKAEVAGLGIQADAAEILEKRIGNITQTPNANKLEKVFVDLGIGLSKKDRTTISTRNKCLHGNRTMRANPDLGVLGSEIERFDTLVTLVQKAILKLLEYRGPYVDYGARPAHGNFPIKSL